MYKTSEFRGAMRDDIMFSEEVGGKELYDKMKAMVMESVKKKGIPATFREDIVKSGGIFGTEFPILIISNPNPENKFFDLGFFVNGQTISFPLLGMSSENTKANKKKQYEAEGKFLRSMMIKPDEFKLQQEIEWQSLILHCVSEFIH